MCSPAEVEFRKAQDLVIRAFREFAARHDDAVLVAAWHSPWAGTSAGFQGSLPVPLQNDANGAPKTRQWATENGIKSHQFIELPLTANSLMPAVLREWTARCRYHVAKRAPTCRPRRPWRAVCR